MEENKVVEGGSAASSPPKKGFFYGWVIVVACGVCYSLLGSFGLSASQIAIPVMVTDPDIMMDRALVGMGFSVFILFQGLLAPVIGSIVEKTGARNTMLIAGCILFVAGILLAFFCGSSTFAYFALFGVMLSFGGAMGSQVPCQTTISTWFVRKRGMAMSFMMVIAGCVGFLIPILANAVILGTGQWSSAFFLISAAAVLGMIVVAVLVKNRPQDKGQLPDGGEVGETAAVQARESRVYKATDHKTVKQAVRTPAFWLFIIVALPLYFGLNMQVSAGVLHFTGAGLDPTLVAVGVSTQGIAAVVARLLVAPLADRIEPVKLMAIACAIMGIGMCAAAFCHDANPVLLFVFYACVGLGFGVNIVCSPVCFANYFGVTHFPKIIGWALPIFSIIAGTIPTIAGFVFNATGSYDGAFLGTAVCCVIGIICAFLVRYPKKAKS